jgi:glycosyltransferase involved in cell wall biosynthesis
MKISVVIPAWNAVATVGRVVGEVKSVADEVIVVDDGSRDDTAAKAKAAGAIVLRHLINRGQGAALVTGTEYALRRGADMIVHFDADGQHQAADIAALVAPIRSGEREIVLGSRFLDKKTKIPWTKKYFILKPALWLQWLMTGLPLTDVHNGLRALSQRAAREIKITQDAFAHASEYVEEIARLKLSYGEVPITVHYHRYGQGWWQGVLVLRDLFFKKFIS